MNLELKHLAPYLPYGLKCFSKGCFIEGTEYNDSPVPKLLTITGMDSNWITVEGIQITVDETIMIEDCIPLLYPLSSIRTYREDLGFIPKSQLSDSLLMQMDILSMPNILDIKVADYNKLLSWHIDIFNLIENNLAIDITALQPLAK